MRFFRIQIWHGFLFLFLTATSLLPFSEQSQIFAHSFKSFPGFPGDRLELNQQAGYLFSTSSLDRITLLPENAWKPFPAMSLGFHLSPFWIRIHGNAAGFPAGTLYLELENPYIKDIEAYVTLRGEDGKTILKKKEISRMTLLDRNPGSDFDSWPLFTIPHGQEKDFTIYLRIQSPYPLRIPIYLYTRTGFEIKLGMVRLMNGLFYGAHLVLLLILFMIWLRIRDRRYILLLAALLFFVIFHMGLDGFFRAAPAPFPPLLGFAVPSISFYTVSILLILFLESHVQDPSRFPVAFLFLRIIRWSLFILGLLVFVDVGLASRLTFPLAGIFEFSLAGVAVYLWKKRNQPIRFFVIATLIYLTPSIYFILLQLGFVSTYISPFYLKNITMASSLFITMSLFDRISLFHTTMR